MLIFLIVWSFIDFINWWAKSILYSFVLAALRGSESSSLSVESNQSIFPIVCFSSIPRCSWSISADSCTLTIGQSSVFQQENKYVFLEFIHSFWSFGTIVSIYCFFAHSQSGVPLVWEIRCLIPLSWAIRSCSFSSTLFPCRIQVIRIFIASSQRYFLIKASSLFTDNPDTVDSKLKEYLTISLFFWFSFFGFSNTCTVRASVRSKIPWLIRGDTGIFWFSQLSRVFHWLVFMLSIKK